MSYEPFGDSHRPAHDATGTWPLNVIATASFHTELEAAALVDASALVAIVMAMGPAIARNPAGELRQE